MAALPSPMPANPSPEAWKFLGYVTKERREFIGLSQEELARYGGPKKSTVGKIENARETSYSPRTMQQMEKALGWDRGTTRLILMAGHEYDEDMRESVAADYIEAELPDLTGSPSVGGVDEDEDTFLYRRPAGLTDEQWRRLRARTDASVEREIEQALKESGVPPLE